MKFCLLVLLSLLSAAGLNAQTIYGIKLDPPANSPNSTSYLSTIDQVSGQVDLRIPIPSASGILFPNYTFDHERGAYVFSGSANGNSTKLFSIFVDSSAIYEPVITPPPNSTLTSPELVEYDMNLGKCFALYRTNNKTLFVELDLFSGNILVIDTLHQISGYVNMASTFDANHHRYIFQGVATTGDKNIYFVDAGTGQITKQLPLTHPQAAQTAYNSFEWDNNTDKLIANYYLTGNAPAPLTAGVYMAEIDTSTGAVTNLTSGPVLPGTPGTVLQNSDFDQATRQYIWVAIVGGTYRLVTFDLDSAAIVHMPSHDFGFYFLQVDNSQFASRTYGLATNVEAPLGTENQLEIYPNPVRDILKFNLPDSGEPLQVMLYDMKGRQVVQQDIARNRSNSEINMVDMLPGIYTVVIRNREGIIGSKKVLKMDPQ